MNLKLVTFLLAFTPLAGLAQFDKIKSEIRNSIPVQKIFKIDTAVFTVLEKYAEKKISEKKFDEQIKLATKTYTSIYNSLSIQEKICCDRHKKDCQKTFLSGDWRK